MFEQPNFSSLLTGEQDVQFSDVVHKAFIKVDEIGTEASAATGKFLIIIELIKKGKYFMQCFAFLQWLP